MAGTPDPEAVEGFVQHVAKPYTAAMLQYALTKCGGNLHDAEDVVHEVLRKLWKQWLEDPDKVREGGIRYLMTAVFNTAMDQHRSRTRRSEHQFDPELHERRAPDDVEDACLFGELQRELWAAVATLTEVQQQLIQLIYVGGYTLSGAARHLGLAKATAHRYHKFALEDLKEIITGPE